MGERRPDVAAGSPGGAVRASRRLLAVLLLATLLGACRSAGPADLDATVVARHPHDPGAFTQGLLWHDGHLYESTGLRGRSSLRRVDPTTGDVLAIRYLPDDLFAEGLARVGDRLIQLTWQAGRALVWPLEGFERGEPPLDRFSYDGEGWGLCFDGERLVMSDGSDRLTFRDPEDFSVSGSVQVTLDGEPLEALNELECVDGSVWANVWYEDVLVRIDPASGRVAATLDLSDLLTDEERADLADGAVLNGIAWNDATGTMWVTGKLWPLMFELRIADGEGAARAP